MSGRHLQRSNECGGSARRHLERATAFVSFAALAAGLALFASPAAATDVEILIDAGGALAEGCTVSHAGEEMEGVDNVLRASVDTFTAEVFALGLASCDDPATNGFGPSFALSQPVAPPWDVGIGAGTAGADVVELAVPLSMLPIAGDTNGLRVGLRVSEGFLQTDVVFSRDGTPGGPPVYVLPLGPALPALGPAGGLLLAGVLALVALRALRSRRGRLGLLAALLVSSTCAVVATTNPVWAQAVLDGLIGDWAGIAPRATDPADDAEPGTEAVALFGKAEDGNLYLRADVHLDLCLASCDDGDPCTIDTCQQPVGCVFSSAVTTAAESDTAVVEGTLCDFCAEGYDSDGDGYADCLDLDCVAPGSVCSGGAEVCSDTGPTPSFGIDDDGDGASNEADPDCSLAGPNPCANGLDDDGDGYVDCLDYECFFGQTCRSGGELCGTPADDDGDGVTNEADPDCGSCQGDGDDDGDGHADCWDPDCAGSPYCLAGAELCFNGGFQTSYGTDDDGDGAPNEADPSCGSCSGGIDDDGDGFADCLDLDCFVSGFCVGNGEICTTPGDEDGDGVADEADPDCGACTSPFDEDGDGDVGCADTDCAGSPYCFSGGENCSELDFGPGGLGQDEDGDGVANEADPECGSCLNGSDDDADGFVDCFDFDCVPVSACIGNGENCLTPGDEDGDGVADEADPDCGFCTSPTDTDGDGLVGCVDPDCAGSPHCLAGPEICSDGLPDGTGVDDDGDGVANEADPSCGSCTNGLDDDGDGWADCLDFDCLSAGACFATGEVCGTPGDEDGDGFPDESDTECGLCSPGNDGDGDGVSGCADPDCALFVGCLVGPEVCNDGPPEGFGVDEDGDGAANEADPSCGSCTNGLDDDGDGLPDCQDPDCFDFGGVTCFEQCTAFGDEDWDGLPNEADPDCGGCSDLVDGDGDGAVDCYDPDCAVDCSNRLGEVCGTPGDEDADTLFDESDPECGGCTDLADGDGDGLIDCEDPNCVDSEPVCTPGNETCTAGPNTTPARIGDDSDGDGFYDEADPDCGSCSDGLDNDGDGLVDCFDGDCQIGIIAVCDVTGEDCSTLGDEDGDGVADSADPECGFCNTWGSCQDAECALTPRCLAGAEDCTTESPEGPGARDGAPDDDGDGAANEGDPSCGSCSNGLDDDGDGFIDCRDRDCNRASECVLGPEDCLAPGDEDGDGVANEADPGCGGGLGRALCDDGLDNDADGLVDCYDPDCREIDPFCVTRPATETCTPFSLFARDDEDWDGLVNEADPECGGCSDGIDGDGDGRVDCLDADCYSTPACNGGGEDCSTPGDQDGDLLSDEADPDCGRCDDGIDNDGDGFTDCLDADCPVFWQCLGPENCFVAGDEDGNGLADEADGRCGACGISGFFTGQDVDRDGLAECYDPDCAVSQVCLVGAENCTNPDPVVPSLGIDDDGDDTPNEADRSCGSCTNGVDDDGDGFADCLDYDCRPDPACFRNGELCNTPGDDDGDGLADEADPDCGSCQGGGDEDWDGLTDCDDPDCAADPACVP